VIALPKYAQWRGTTLLEKELACPESRRVLT